MELHGYRPGSVTTDVEVDVAVCVCALPQLHQLIRQLLPQNKLIQRQQQIYPVESGVPFVPSHKYHPEGTLPIAPYHSEIIPVGIVVPVLVAGNPNNSIKVIVSSQSLTPALSFKTNL